jgi:hypothetical protein
LRTRWAMRGSWRRLSRLGDMAWARRRVRW